MRDNRSGADSRLDGEFFPHKLCQRRVDGRHVAYGISFEPKTPALRGYAFEYRCCGDGTRLVR